MTSDEQVWRQLVAIDKTGCLKKTVLSINHSGEGNFRVTPFELLKKLITQRAGEWKTRWRAEVVELKSRSGGNLTEVNNGSSP